MKMEITYAIKDGPVWWEQTRRATMEITGASDEKTLKKKVEQWEQANGVRALAWLKLKK